MIVACADAPAQSPLKLQATSEHIIRVEEQVSPFELLTRGPCAVVSFGCVSRLR